eukprot:3920546-Amphidinium_carterae.1
MFHVLTSGTAKRWHENVFKFCAFLLCYFHLLRSHLRLTIIPRPSCTGLKLERLLPRTTLLEVTGLCLSLVWTCLWAQWDHTFCAHKEAHTHLAHLARWVRNWNAGSTKNLYLRGTEVRNN